MDRKSSDVVYVDQDFEDLIPEFFQDIRNGVQSMREALENNNYETVQQLSHGIKGSGGAYGFDAITDIASSLVNAAKTGNQDDMQKYTTELLDYLEGVQVEYQ